MVPFSPGAGKCIGDRCLPLTGRLQPPAQAQTKPASSYTGSTQSVPTVSRYLSWSVYLGLSYGLLSGTPHAELSSSWPQAQFAARAEGVLVDVEVTRGGKPVGGLTTSDFSLRDDGVVQTIEVSPSSNGAVNTVLALDGSASTAGQRLLELTAASRTFLDNLGSGDRAALVTFNHFVQPVLPLTEDLSAVRAALGRLRPQGNTALIDGVYTALLTAQDAIGATLIVVYTDGVDTASWLNGDEVTDAATRSNAVVEAIVARSAHTYPDLKRVVDATAGRIVEVGPKSDLAREFAGLLAEFRHRYLVTFTPRGVAPAGYHRLEVRVRGNGLVVYARPGYVRDPRDD
jgi:VWFA-related protein